MGENTNQEHLPQVPDAETIDYFIRSKFPEDRQQDAKELAMMVVSFYHSGPLPTPAMLADYEKVVPGLAEHIVKRSDKEQEFRHNAVLFEQENLRNSLRHAAISTYIGQASALTITLLAICAGIFFVWKGKDTTGLTTMISALVALVVAFVTGRLTNTKSKKARQGLKKEEKMRRKKDISKKKNIE